MNRKSLRLALLALCLMLATVGSSIQAQPSAQSEQAAWTFMVYMAADNDLEPYAINDLMEMQAVGSTDAVNIVVEMDRSEEYEAISGDWSDTRRFYIEQATGSVSSGDFEISIDALMEELDQFDPDDLGVTEADIEGLRNAPQEEVEAAAFGLFSAPAGGGAETIGIQQESIESLDEVNTGDPATLVDFATWAIENYPADRYALILWNHGGGWTMITSDEYDDDVLTMPEVAEALDEIIANTGIEKFDLVAFDACLMAQLEVYETLAPYARYTIAAEETIPGAGWEYATIFNALNDNPEMSIPELGQVVVDAYIEFYSTVVTSYEEFDLHIIDLENSAAVAEALDNFVATVASDPESLVGALGNARNDTQIFGGKSPDETDGMSSVDLVHFMELTMAITDDEAVQQAAQGVIDAARDLVLYGQQVGLPGSNGVAVYFPFTMDAYSIDDHTDTYPEQAPESMAGWVSFLDMFHGTASEVYSSGDLSVAITAVYPSEEAGSIYDPPVIEFETDGSGIIDMSFTAALQLEDGSQIVVDESSLDFTYTDANGYEISDYPEGFSENVFTWNAEMPVVTDGETSVPTVILTDYDDASSGAISGIYYWSGGQEATAYLQVDLESGEVTSVWGVEETSAGDTSSEINPYPGDQFMPTWRSYDEEGELTFIPSEEYLTFSTEPFTIEFVPADSGDYTLALFVTDIAGNVAYDETSFSVDNEGLDESVRGFKDVQFGINFLYPWSWSDPQVQEDEEGTVTLQLNDPDGYITTYINTYEVESVDDLLNIALEQLEGYGAEAGEPEYSEDLNGYEAYFVEYTYEGEEGESRTGIMTLVYVEENGLGYVIDIDSDDEAYDTAVEVFNTLTGSITFFAPSE